MTKELIPISGYRSRNILFAEVSPEWKLRITGGSGDMLDIASLDPARETIAVRNEKGDTFSVKFGFRASHWRFFATAETLPAFMRKAN